MITIDSVEMIYKNDFATTFQVKWSNGNKEYMTEARIFEGDVSVSSVHERKTERGFYTGYRVRLGKTKQDIWAVEKELKEKVKGKLQEYIR